MRVIQNYFRLLLLVALSTVALGFARVSATSVSEGYKTTDKSLVVGMAAALSPESTSNNRVIERASTANQDRFVGVVTTSDANLLTLADQDSTIYVATLGDVAVYASDLNGEIKKGDFVMLSPLKGVVMRANTTDTMVVGTALETFSSEKAKAQEVTANNGSNRTVLVNKIRIELNPRNLSRSDKENTFLLIFGRSLTGKAVNQLQVISALVIFFFLIVVEGSIVYGAIYSSITALGRNPLARTAVYKQLFQVGLVAFVVLAFGLSAIYAVLWA